MIFQVEDSETIVVSLVNTFEPPDDFYDKFFKLQKQFPNHGIIESGGSQDENEIYISMNELTEEEAEEVQIWMDENINNE